MLILGWELGARTGFISKLILPAPSEALGALWNLIKSGTRSHLEGVSRAQMHEYLLHHLTICGVKHDIFDQAAVTAIHQGSGGLFRKANHLARGAIIVAAEVLHVCSLFFKIFENDPQSNPHRQSDL